MPPRLRDLARRQGGCFTYEQALTAGLAPHDLRRMVGDREVLRIMPRVYIAATTPATVSAQEHASVLRYGAGSALSHESAAGHWGMTRTPTSVTLAIPLTHRSGTHPPWLTVVRTELIQPTFRHGLPITRRERTIADLAARATRRDLTAVIYAELQAGRIDLASLKAANGERGRRAGTSLMRSVLAELEPDHESLLTFELHTLARRVGLDELVPSLVLPTSRGSVTLDLGDPARFWDLEADGWAYHGSRSQQQRDRARDRGLRELGWEVSRFDTDEIRRQGDMVMRELERTAIRLGRRAA